MRVLQLMTEKISEVKDRVELGGTVYIGKKLSPDKDFSP